MPLHCLLTLIDCVAGALQERKQRSAVAPFCPAMELRAVLQAAAQSCEVPEPTSVAGW